MIKQKLYTSLVKSQPILPAIAFVMTFAVVAANLVGYKHNLVYASSLLPANQITTSITPGADIAADKPAKKTGFTIFGTLHLFGGNAKSDSKQTSSSQSATNKSDSKQSSRTVSTSSTTASTASATSTASTPPPATAVKPAPAPAPAPAPTPSWTYPLHVNIKTTYFWAGEAASADNDFIQNVSSAWQSNWAAYFGGEDNPYSRCGYNPCGFTPHENPFYFALPFGDFTETGPINNPSVIPWYNAAAQAQLNNGQSILKNRWIQINLGNKTAYAQWEDVGPFNSNDSAYVFGSAAPKSTRAGLDVSPAVRDYLGMGGSATTSWRFVTAAEVPAGPWKTTVTTSGTDWN